MGTKSRFLSEQEKIYILEQYNNGKSTKKIGYELGRNPVSIQRFLKSLGIKNLKENGYSRRTQKYILDLQNFDNEEFSDYWAGFIAADGCIYNGKGQKRLIINLSNKDKHHLEKFTVGYPVTETKRQSCVIDIPSNKLCELLESKYNITGKKSLTLKYPINLTNHSHFIRGYFDGDGCIYVYDNYGLRGRVFIYGTYDFLLEVQKRIPCESKIKKYSNSSIYELSVSKKAEVNKFFNFIYNNSSIYLKRKKEKFLSLTRVEL